MDYTICKKVIELSKDGQGKYPQLLFHFMSNNSNKVVINNLILDSYKRYNTSIIHTWIDLMDKQGMWKKINDPDCAESELFIKTCHSTYDKKLIVSEKEDYDVEQYEELDVMNKDEAYISLCSTTHVNNINGDNNSITTGNSSPISMDEG